MSFLLATYKIISVTHEDCEDAMALQIEDFEDALVATCAQKADADYIITRDGEILNSTLPLKLISPKDFIKILGEGS